MICLYLFLLVVSASITASPASASISARPVSYAPCRTIVVHLTILSFKAESEDQERNVDQCDTEGDEIVVRPVLLLRKVRRGQRCRECSKACEDP